MNLAIIVRTGPVLIFGIIWVVQFFQEPDPETQTQSLQEKKKRESTKAAPEEIRQPGDGGGRGAFCLCRSCHRSAARSGG